MDRQEMKKPLTPMEAVRAYCLECSHGSREDLKECPAAQTCSLWPYRFGKSPTEGISHQHDKGEAI